MARDQEIFPLLRIIANNGSALRMVSLYKGLPIIYDTQVVSVEPTAVHFHCNKYQLACLFLEHEAYLVGDQIDGTIHAEVSGLVPKRDEAILTQLQYIDRPYILRDQIRVEPQEPLRINLQLKGSLATVPALLADISLNGLGIYIDRNIFHPRLWQTGVDLTVSIPMPGNAPLPQNLGLTSPLQTTDLSSRFSREAIRGLGFLEESDPQPHRGSTSGTGPNTAPGIISARGVIVNLRPELMNSRYRLGIRLIHENNARFIIAQFIAQRQTEIIREFKDIYTSLTQYEKVKPG